MIIETLKDICPSSPIIGIPFVNDRMMHTKNCKKMHNYLNNDLFDVELLDSMIHKEFGLDKILLIN
jgi:hypothetical protein